MALVEVAVACSVDGGAGERRKLASPGLMVICWGVESGVSGC